MAADDRQNPGHRGGEQSPRQPSTRSAPLSQPTAAPVALQEGETILAKCAGLCGHLQAREVHRHLPDSSGDRTQRRAVHATPNNSRHQRQTGSHSPEA
ncbi:hypothetical protein JOB18_005852 [Solea senegalensis]|uniref:Uncharacterized protein n=1 Tax=Solea senegalensis TaxID=28829 RepID=A0AAV6SCM8_SOLSE|nr:hypothetical protein JOB18_005852 [Solea senegalensis]